MAPITRTALAMAGAAEGVGMGAATLGVPAGVEPIGAIGGAGGIELTGGIEPTGGIELTGGIEPAGGMEPTGGMELTGGIDDLRASYGGEEPFTGMGDGNDPGALSYNSGGDDGCIAGGGPDGTVKPEGECAGGYDPGG